MTTTSEVGLQLLGVSKQFGATRALRDVSLDLEAGKVHAFVGENGAGKSTCLGVLAGRVSADGGTVRVFGRDLNVGDPRESRKAGIVSIYQELTIVPALSPQANVFLGIPRSRIGFLRETDMRQRYEELCADIGVQAAPARVAAGTLSVAEQQLLEIMRALVVDARIVLLDEPTASLAMSERDALLRLIDRLRSSGLTIVFVSHNLDEVLQIADTVSVFRDGALTAHGPAEHWDKGAIVRQMLGDETNDSVVEAMLETVAGSRTGRATPGRHGDLPVLRVKDLRVPGVIHGLDLEIYPGEIVGLGGLVGSGRTTVLRCLAGLEPRATGQLWFHGKSHAIPRTVKAAHRLGICLIPEDRKGQGLVLGLDGTNNIALAETGRTPWLAPLFRTRMRRNTRSAAERAGFDVRRLDEAARNLSGGNQQKLMIARWCLNPPELLLADEPTRGIDIGAKSEIIETLRGMAVNGMALLVVSSELEELSALSDRVVVLAEGHHAGTLDGSTDPITPSRIMSSAFALAAAE